MIKITFENDAIQTFVDNTAQNIEMDNGFLIIRAVKRDGSPLPNAIIKISGQGKDLTLRTDSKGTTEQIKLPAPAKKYSLIQTSIELPYLTYDVRVEYPGYYTNIYQDEQVFARTLTDQISIMIPLPPGAKNALEKVYKIPPPSIAR